MISVAVSADLCIAGATDFDSTVADSVDPPPSGTDGTAVKSGCLDDGEAEGADTGRGCGGRACSC